MAVAPNCGLPALRSREHPDLALGGEALHAAEERVEADDATDHHGVGDGAHRRREPRPSGQERRERIE